MEEEDPRGRKDLPDFSAFQLGEHVDVKRGAPAVIVKDLIVRADFGLAFSFAAEMRWITFAAVIVKLKEGPVFEVEFLLFGNGFGKNPAGVGDHAVTFESERNQPVDVDPDGAAPHVFRIGFRVFPADGGNAEGGCEGGGIAEVREQFFRLFLRRCAADERKKARRG